MGGDRLQGGEIILFPGVWRSVRPNASVKADDLARHGMDEIEIPAFLRKQAD